MKRSIIKRLFVIILIPMVFSVVLNYFIQLKASKNLVFDNSKKLFDQIVQLLDRNTIEEKKLQEDFDAKCIVRARAAAYMLEYNPEAVSDLSEMRHIAELLEVDEVHVFDTEGNLFSGSNPEYYGLNFNSGEQMRFFLPMLTDKTLELCQEVEPNTGANVPMQYAAAWCGNGKIIVQIGMKPERVVEETEKVQLSYAFSTLAIDSGACVYALNQNTHEIMGCTEENRIGKTAEELGFAAEHFQETGKVHSMTINGEKCFVTFAQTNGIILARTIDSAVTYKALNRDCIWLVVYLTFISLIIFSSVLLYLDKVIIKKIYGINDRLASIAAGNLDVRLYRDEIPEFDELGIHINDMIISLLDVTNKISVILDKVNLPIGAYEYNSGMKRVMTTRRVRELMHLSEREAAVIFSNDKLFAEKIAQIRQHPLSNESNIYVLLGDRESYVRIDSFEYEKSTIGIIMDVSQEIIERKRIEQERDEDLLTGALSRRAFVSSLGAILEQQGEMKHAALVMIDSDRLKYVNDHYGHQSGDKYLRGIVERLMENSAGHKLIGRLGGDEFALFIYDCETREELKGCLTEILEGRDHQRIPLRDGKETILKYSVGYAIYGEDGSTQSDLLKIADERMYQDKNRRKRRAASSLRSPSETEEPAPE